MGANKPDVKPRKASAGKVINSRVQKKKAIKRKAPAKQQYNNEFLKIDPDRSHSKIAKQNQQSPLLSLPTEIRNKIYGHVLGGNEYKVYVPKNKPVCMIEDGPRKTNRELLSVCTQIYSETVTLPYALNTISVWPHLMNSWTDSLFTAQKNSITTLSFNYPEARRAVTGLRNFPGLRQIYVLYTPDEPYGLKEIVNNLRMTAEKPNLKVTFRRFG